ncbi:MAG: Na+/H+ antiporter NhaA [Actinomycetota bacterium]|nr:Na+/H+ antiporter NhaA [Actinomycetota bacterium]
MSVRNEAFTGGESRLARQVAQPLARFLHQETSSSILLIIAAAAALIWANFGGDSYSNFWNSTVELAIGSWHPLTHEGHGLSLGLWVNDVLMVLFFFVVGLEIKHEAVVGELSDPRVAALPIIAAFGGMVVPALIYTILNAGGSGSGGWGVPVATDIAFAVGVLALLGNRAPQRLKIFLLTLAIADDILAIAVIAVFYSSGFGVLWFGAALGGLALMYVLRRSRVWYIPVYAIIGAGVWYATFRSGIHATIAGVAMGLLAPAKPLIGEPALAGLQDILTGDELEPAAVRDATWRAKETVPVTVRLSSLLSPWTSFLIVPIFALSNAGVKLSSSALSDAVGSPVTWGVIAGLVIGKPIGVALFSFVGIKFKVASMPPDTTLAQIFGVGAVAGIGFTVALFVAGLAFDDKALADQATIGILAASAFAAVAGFLLLWVLGGRPPKTTEPETATH